MKNEVAVSVNGVSKDFVLPHEKVTSLKRFVTGGFRRSTSKEVQHALKDISFEVKKGEFFGIVGRNGSGKSTLLKIIAEIYRPTKGNVTVNGRLVPFIELGVGFNPELTGRENVFLNGALLGFSRSQIAAQYQAIVDFAELELFMDQKLKNYSSGMQVRLAFSMAIRSKADILLIDEVLAVGDADFQRKCFDYFQKLKGSDTTAILVTHDMNAVREYCDRAMLIEKSAVIIEGLADEVASRYSRMFINEAKADNTNNGGTRWGDSRLRYQSVNAPKLLRGEETISFTVKIQAQKSTKNINIGFLIKNAAKTHILGTNTEIARMPRINLKAGEQTVLTWTVPNIFNDGKHFIDAAVVYKGGAKVADWWEDAVSFRVINEQRTPYIVNPKIVCQLHEAN